MVIKQDQGLVMVNQFDIDAESEIYSGALTFGLYSADNSKDPGKCARQQMIYRPPDRNHLSLQPLFLLLLFRVTELPSPFGLFMPKYSLSFLDPVLAAINLTSSILNQNVLQNILGS